MHAALSTGPGEYVRTSVRVAGFGSALFRGPLADARSSISFRAHEERGTDHDEAEE